VPDFHISEFEQRLDRAQRAMKAAQLDALMFTTEAEMRYFTGFRTLFWQSPTRPWFLLLPVAGAPIAIIPEIGATLMRSTWVDDIRTWSSPHPNDDGVSLLVEALEGRGSVGLMMGRESQLRMPLADYQAITNRVRSTEFVDATPLVQALRMVKSDAEIAYISTICGIASTAFDQANKLFFEGQALEQAFRAFKIALLEAGADDVPYLVGGAGPGGYGDVISPPGDKPLMAGDVLMLDIGATIAGYHCDFDRNFAFGHADDDAKQAYKTLYEATNAALAMARPGVKCNELYGCIAGELDGGVSNVGRYGHGLGLQLTEAPSLIGFDETVLEAGMVITLEPSMEVADGKIMVHEENILICDGPPKLLSKRAPDELPIL